MNLRNLFSVHSISSRLPSVCLGMASIIGCENPDAIHASHYVDSSPTPSDSANLEDSFWRTDLALEEELISAHTSIRLYIGKKSEDVYDVQVWHTEGTLIVDGTEIAQDEALLLEGLYLREREIFVASVEAFGHSLILDFDVDGNELKGYAFVDSTYEIFLNLHRTR